MFSFVSDYRVMRSFGGLEGLEHSVRMAEASF